MILGVAIGLTVAGLFWLWMFRSGESVLLLAERPEKALEIDRSEQFKYLASNGWVHTVRLLQFVGHTWWIYEVTDPVTGDVWLTSRAWPTDQVAAFMGKIGIERALEAQARSY